MFGLLLYPPPPPCVCVCVCVCVCSAHLINSTQKIPIANIHSRSSRFICTDPVLIKRKSWRATSELRVVNKNCESKRWNTIFFLFKNLPKCVFSHGYRQKIVRYDVRIWFSFRLNPVLFCACWLSVSRSVCTCIVLGALHFQHPSIW